jgi:hypothetical protein
MNNGRGSSKDILIIRNGNIFSNIVENKTILRYGISFVSIFLVLNILIRKILFEKGILDFDCPPYWPISIFYPLRRLPSVSSVVMVILTFLIFLVVIKLLKKRNYNFVCIILGAIILIGATNLIHGFHEGFIDPLYGGGELDKISGRPVVEYYHDAIEIGNPLNFLRDYESLQPNLLSLHSRTHPSGAVLVFYFFISIFGDNPGLISFAIGALSISVTLFFYRGILKSINEYKETNLPEYMSFLLGIIPAIQIYYLATLDALISTCLLGVLYFYLKPNTTKCIIGSSICLFLASFMTFMFVYMLPVIFGFEILKRKRIWKSTSIVFILGLIYFLIFLIFGYNYVNSFKIALSVESEFTSGFFLLTDPISYFFTRLESILEIVVFFGPFLIMITVNGLSVLKRKNYDFFLLTILAILTLVSMLLLGTFRTGETARICTFILPYLLFPVVAYIEEVKPTQKEKHMLLWLVFLQTILMQFFGFYHW